MFAPCIALAIGAKFVPLRKRGKLPGKCEFVIAYISHTFLDVDFFS